MAGRRGPGGGQAEAGRSRVPPRAATPGIPWRWCSLVGAILAGPWRALLSTCCRACSALASCACARSSWRQSSRCRACCARCACRLCRCRRSSFCRRASHARRRERLASSRAASAATRARTTASACLHTCRSGSGFGFERQGEAQDSVRVGARAGVRGFGSELGLGLGLGVRRGDGWGEGGAGWGLGLLLCLHTCSFSCASSRSRSLGPRPARGEPSGSRRVDASSIAGATVGGSISSGSEAGTLEAAEALPAIKRREARMLRGGPAPSSAPLPQRGRPDAARCSSLSVVLRRSCA